MDKYFIETLTLCNGNIFVSAIRVYIWGIEHWMFLPVGLTDALPTCGLAHNCMEQCGFRAQPCVDHPLILTMVQQCVADHIGQRSYTSCTKDRSLTFMNARWSLRSSAEGDPKTEAIFSLRTTSQLFPPPFYSSYSPSSISSSMSSCLLPSISIFSSCSSRLLLPSCCFTSCQYMLQILISWNCKSFCKQWKD